MQRTISRNAPFLSYYRGSGSWPSIGSRSAHDLVQLLLAEACSNPTTATVPQLTSYLRNMLAEEQALRTKLKGFGVEDQAPLKSLPDRKSLEDGQHKVEQCAICRQDLVISFVTCNKAKCKDRKVCLHHAHQLCCCEMSSRQLYFRYSGLC